MKNDLNSGSLKMSKSAMKKTKGGEREVYYSYELKNVQVSSYQVDSKGRTPRAK